MLHVSFEAIGLMLLVLVIQLSGNIQIRVLYPDIQISWQNGRHFCIRQSEIPTDDIIFSFWSWTSPTSQRFSTELELDPSLHMKTVNACKGTAFSWVSWQNILHLKGIPKKIFVNSTSSQKANPQTQKRHALWYSLQINKYVFLGFWNCVTHLSFSNSDYAK